MARHELRVAKEAAAGDSNTDDTVRALVKHPKIPGNLKAALSLTDDPERYKQFCVSPFFILTKCVRT